MLHQEYQDRLDNWRKNVLEVPSAEKVRAKQQAAYRANRDYGDDIRDYEKKDEEAWARELANNPIYRGYR